MKPESLKLVYFSPAGTTPAVVNRISRGMNQDVVEIIDITSPDARQEPLQISGNKLLNIAVPVYVKRVPELVIKWLQNIHGKDIPVVCVVVYGNRAFDDALLELKDVLTTCGCHPIACAAFVGEHSFSNPETPLAAGRPDDQDLDVATMFGRQIEDKLQSIASVDQIPEISVPGEYPYRGDAQLWTVDFIAVNVECQKCGCCAKECPTGAIDLENESLIDTTRCITCRSCIKRCPKRARTMKLGRVKDVAKRLVTLCRERKEPALFF